MENASRCFPSTYPDSLPEPGILLQPWGLLVRHDYTAEVFGNWARAAHYSWEHRDSGGIIIPTKRRVFPRKSSGHPFRGITLVSIEIEDVKVTEKA